MFNEEKRLINGTSLRKAKGEKDTEAMIAAFLQRIKQPLEESKADRLAITAQNAESRRASAEMRNQGSVPRQLGGRTALNTPVSSASGSPSVTNMLSPQSSPNDYVTEDMLTEVIKNKMDDFMNQVTDLMKNMQVVPAQ
jgi:hypothetical protein